MLIPINQQLLAQVQQQAQTSPRRRAIHRFHEHPNLVQRMINVIEPDSYIMPHKHENPDKVEAFIILKGRAAILSFDEAGSVTSIVSLEAGGASLGAEVPARTWHSIISLEPGTTLYEVIQGPYEVASHKTFAAWAPPAEDLAGGLAWIQQLKQQHEL